LIEALLREREREGTSLARLARRSGIPLGTLSYWSWRRRRGPRSAFVDVVVDARAAEDRAWGGGSEVSPFEIVLSGGRRLVVPPGFDADELRRLLRAAEDAC